MQLQNISGLQHLTDVLTKPLLKDTNPVFSCVTIKDLKSHSPKVSFYNNLCTLPVTGTSITLKYDGLYLLYTSLKHVKYHTSR